MPEIAILSGNVGYGSLPLHPNISGIPQSDAGSLTGGIGGLPNYGGLPTSGSSAQKALFALTIDLNESASANKLKLSFLLEHQDVSTDTGFTMFDFDNDGVNEICYRDMKALRIIKPVIPYVKNAYVGSGGSAANNHPEVILLTVPCQSRTGYEYPIIADIDNDGSADMIIPGGDTDALFSHVFAISTNGDKFASAWPVWNQYMYDPFKIKPDSLTTPLGPAPDRLKYKFLREIKNSAGDVVKVIPEYQPFNGNMIQASYIDPHLLPKFEPLVYLTDAHIYNSTTSKAPRIRTEGGNTIIELWISNLASARATVTSNMPIAVYKNNTITEGTRIFKKTLSQLLPIAGGTIGGTALGDAFTLAPGEEANVALVLGPTATYSADDVYIVRLGDDSEGASWRFGYNGGERYGTVYPCSDFNEGLGVSSKAFRDCDWCNQVVRAAKYQSLHDLFTIQEFHELSLDVLANDILPVVPSPPDNMIFMDTVKLGSWNIVEQPKAGYLTFNNTAGAGARIIYHHDNRDDPKLDANIDSFVYSLSYYDVGGTNTVVTKNATVYIYIMESSSGGFSTCYDKITDIRLTELPVGVRFDWFNHNLQQVAANGIQYVTKEMQGDSVYYLKPIMTGVTPTFNKYKNLNFPNGKLTVRLATYPAKPTSEMRWTGHANRQWRDPQNWVEVRTINGRKQESPVPYSPSECSDVIIQADVDNFPELTDTAVCNNIALSNRAMLRNPHVLKYASASVELKLKPSERDRFVMWSAPLTDVYSGDYHYRSITGVPQWGDVFMNLFQRSNPQGGAAEINRFTATFPNVDYALPLGMPFNLKVTTTTATRDSILRFPKAENAYTPAGASNPVNIARSANRNKFITHGMNLNQYEMFSLPVRTDISTPGADQRLVQVVNPYLAYLSIDDFLTNNANLLQSGYYIWNGEVGSDMTAVALTNGNRITASSSIVMTNSLAYIPPLQSFFVAKKAAGDALTSVNMSPNWTTTSPASSYTLRAAAMVKSGGVMHIRLTNGNQSAHAALSHTIGSGPMIDKEDMPAVIHTVENQTSLSLYTFASNNEPLAINSSEHFAMIPVSLGLIAKDAGEYRLEFTNLESFGYDVILIDKQAGNKQTDLGKTPEYTFSITKPSGSSIIEINNRFELRLTYTGLGITITASELAPSPSGIQVRSGRGYIQVRSSGDIGSIRIYDPSGRQVYNNPDVNDRRLQIPVSGSGMYIVEATTGGRMETSKIIIK